MTSMAMLIHRGGDGMSGKSIISNAYLEDIGDAIRQKKETDETYYPSQMGDAIRSIEGIVPSGTLEIDAEGTYDVTQYAEATVDIPDPVITSLTVTKDGTYSVPQGVDGYNPVTVSTGVAELQEEIDSAIKASGCDPLVEGITALTAQANAVTGASDATLADAVGSLISGFGGEFKLVAEEILSANILDNDATPALWLERYGLTQNVSDGDRYFYLFDNTGTTANHVRYILFCPPLSGQTNIHAISVRMRYSVADNLTTWCNANTGSEISVYKF